LKGEGGETSLASRLKMIDRGSERPQVDTKDFIRIPLFINDSMTKNISILLDIAPSLDLKFL
jgi:hypothetical protein